MSTTSLVAKIDNGILKINDVELKDSKGEVVTFQSLFSTFLLSFGDMPHLIVGENNETLQNALNFGDSIKDGTNQETLQNLDLFVKEIGPRFTLTQLKEFVHAVEKNGLERGLAKYKKFVRNKASVISGVDAITKQHIESKHEIGFDAGTSVEQFFISPDENVRKFENIGKYLDPSSSREANFYFPNIQQQITLESSIFVELGYTTNCSLIATAIGQDKYKYKMQIYGQTFIKDNTNKRNEDTIRLQICGGNEQKKVILKTKIATELKRSIVVAKGWGDKLQVLLAFFHKLTKTNNFTTITGSVPGAIVAIATCDEIVYNLCCFFGITCLLTSTGQGTIDDDKKIVKINKILHYEPEGLDPTEVFENLKKEFLKIKTDLIKGYVEYRRLITKIRDTTDSQIYLSVNGTDTVYRFTLDFYSFILNDLQLIINFISSQAIDIIEDVNNIQEANAQIKILKTFSVNSFIKEIKPNVFRIAAASNNYCLNIQGKQKPSFLERLSGLKLDNQSFLSIGIRYFTLTVGGGRIHIQKQIGGAPMSDKDYKYFMNDYDVNTVSKGFKVSFNKSDSLEYIENYPDEEIKVNDDEMTDPPAPETIVDDSTPALDRTLRLPLPAGVLSSTVPTFPPPPSGQDQGGAVADRMEVAEVPNIDDADKIEFDAIENLYIELKHIYNNYYKGYKAFKRDLNGVLITDGHIVFGTASFYYFWSEIMLRLEVEPDYSTANLNVYAEEIITELLLTEFEEPEEPVQSVPLDIRGLIGLQDLTKKKRDLSGAGGSDTEPRETSTLIRRKFESGSELDPVRTLLTDFYGGKKSKKQTRKYSERTNKRTRYGDKSKKSKKLKSNKTRKYRKKRLS